MGAHNTIKAPEQSSGIKGIVTLKTFDVASEEAAQIDAYLKDAKDMPYDVFQYYVTQLDRMCYGRTASFQNLVVQAGRVEIVKQLSGESSTALPISYGALGTGNTAVNASDTTLVTEAVRKGVASKTRTNTTLSIDFYYSKTDWNGTAQEFGTFINGSATADTGTLFNRVLTGGWAKSATEALTVSVQFDLNAT